MTVRIAQELKAPNAKGVFVYDISESSDAYAAGVRQYDIIVSFNNVDDRGSDALHAHAGGFPDRRHGHAGTPAQRPLAFGESPDRADLRVAEPAPLDRISGS